ncbi:variable surface protein [Plasmodium gonderi]|uniref:Variable surface protein n=1 Tax=Plasmodium gonderi TaxID=77519 RepID=A0A1Y1JNQ0_PLAGO|nr:variable surface protein [Plasmodium gonderi]GAW82023.1 variable surface protein [Plasmodium gonderi]
MHTGVNYILFENLDSHFSKYRAIMYDDDNSNPRIYNDECQFMQKEKNEDEQLNYINNKCFNWLPYLNSLRFEIIQTNLIKGLQYMYYWIYTDSSTHGISKEQLKELYRKLIKKYHGTSFGKAAKRPLFPEDNEGEEWEKLIDICDLHNKYNQLKKSLSEPSKGKEKCNYANDCSHIYMKYINKCESNRDSYFCSAFKNIRTEFKELMLIHGCDNIKPQNVPLLNLQKEVIISSRINRSATIIITILVMFLIPFFLFVIYRFTPYNSYINCRMRELINKWNNMNKKWNILKPSEMYNDASRSNRYNLLHHSEYFYN